MQKLVFHLLRFVDFNIVLFHKKSGARDNLSQKTCGDKNRRGGGDNHSSDS